jgi:hypothetical protein
MSQIAASCGKPRSGGEEIELKGWENPVRYRVSHGSDLPSVQGMILVGASREAAVRN